MTTQVTSLFSQRRATLTDDLKSGITVTLSLEKGDLEAFQFLGDRYTDCMIIHDNLHFVPINEDTDIEDTPFPHTYTIDSSALLIAYLWYDGGLNALANSSLRNKLWEEMSKAYNAENAIFNEIQDQKHLEEIEEEAEEYPDED